MCVSFILCQWLNGNKAESGPEKNKIKTLMQSGENLFSQQIFAYAASAVGSVYIQLSYIYEQTMPEKK